MAEANARKPLYADVRKPEAGGQSLAGLASRETGGEIGRGGALTGMPDPDPQFANLFQLFEEFINLTHVPFSFLIYARERPMFYVI